MSFIGVDDRQTTNGSVAFQVYADGVKIYDSGLLLPTSSTKSIDVSVAGVQQLRLHVNDAGDGNAYDHADWADARLTISATAPTVPAAPSGLAVSAASSSQLNLTWTDVASETSYKIQRSIDGVSFTQIATTSAGVTSYSNTGLTASTKYYYRVIASNSVGDSGFSNIASATTLSAPTPPPANSLPAGWSDSDIGNTGTAGSASYSNGVYTVNGAGVGLGGTSDAFNFTSRTLSSNGTLVARVASSTGTGGIMLRDGSGSNAKFVSLIVNASGSVSFVRRTSVGGSTSTTTTAAVTGPVWLRLTRSGKSFTASTSINGSSWSTVGSVSINMSKTVSAGLVTFSKSTALATTLFDNVSLQ
jgi:hypothetical protein